MKNVNTLKIHKKKGYIVVELDNGKVNALDTQIWKDLRETFRDLDKDNSVKGVILSGRPHCFSAGLDVMHLGQLDLEGLKLFWREALGALQTIVRFSKPLVGAVTGYAPAGATILALTTDYRIMGRGDKHVIGMHEFKMSMQIPEMLCDIYAYHMGEKEAWVAVQNAKWHNSDEAVSVGLVNESVEVDEVMGKAEKYIQKLIGVYGPVFQKSKEYLRRGLLKVVDINIEDHVAEIAKQADDPFVKQSMEMFLASLKK